MWFTIDSIHRRRAANSARVPSAIAWRRRGSARARSSSRFPWCNDIGARATRCAFGWGGFRSVANMFRFGIWNRLTFCEKLAAAQRKFCVETQKIDGREGWGGKNSQIRIPTYLEPCAVLTDKLSRGNELIQQSPFPHWRALRFNCLALLSKATAQQALRNARPVVPKLFKLAATLQKKHNLRHAVVKP